MRAVADLVVATILVLGSRSVVVVTAVEDTAKERAL